MIETLLATKLGRYAIYAFAGMALAGVVYWRIYAKGKNAAHAEQVEHTLTRIVEAAKARQKEQENPTDENSDPFNRDRTGR